MTFLPCLPAKINVTFVSAVVKGTRERGGQTNVSPKNKVAGTDALKCGTQQSTSHAPSSPRIPVADPPARLRRASCPSTQARRGFAAHPRNQTPAAAQSASRPRGCSAQAACAAAQRWLRSPASLWLQTAGAPRPRPWAHDAAHVEWKRAQGICIALLRPIVASRKARMPLLPLIAPSPCPFPPFLPLSSSPSSFSPLPLRSIDSAASIPLKFSSRAYSRRVPRQTV